MADYYEVSSVREDRNGKKRWTRLGVAFPFRQGDGFTVSLEAVPAPEEGQFKLILTRPKPKDDQAPARSSSRQQPQDFDDEAPF